MKTSLFKEQEILLGVQVIRRESHLISLKSCILKSERSDSHICISLKPKLPQDNPQYNLHGPCLCT